MDSNGRNLLQLTVTVGFVCLHEVHDPSENVEAKFFRAPILNSDNRLEKKVSLSWFVELVIVFHSD